MSAHHTSNSEELLGLLDWERVIEVARKASLYSWKRRVLDFLFRDGTKLAEHEVINEDSGGVTTAWLLTRGIIIVAVPHQPPANFTNEAELRDWFKTVARYWREFTTLADAIQYLESLASVPCGSPFWLRGPITLLPDLVSCLHSAIVASGVASHPHYRRYLSGQLSSQEFLDWTAQHSFILKRHICELQSWNVQSDPALMLDKVKTTYRHDRKYRLFAIASCERLSQVQMDTEATRVLEFAKLYVEDHLTIMELWSALLQLLPRHARQQGKGGAIFPILHREAVAKACLSRSLLYEQKPKTELAQLFRFGAEEAIFAAEQAREAELAVAAEFTPMREKVAQAELIRDIFPNPEFPPSTIESRWLNDDVHRLAEYIYENECFEQMPILADALEEAGCSDPQILDHCRNGLSHVRGCWVVDGLLGKQ
ncbi:MAG: hypothetical protein ACFCD0_21935 [Gemmataceae bacterium]